MAPKCRKVSENDVVLLRIAQDCSGLLRMRRFGYVWLRLVTPGYIASRIDTLGWADCEGTGKTKR
jgi:hypothetical protein